MSLSTQSTSPGPDSKHENLQLGVIGNASYSHSSATLMAPLDIRPLSLVDARSLKLVKFGQGDIIPPYAIISHKWRDNEVSLQEFQNPSAEIRSTSSYSKIMGACRLARQHGLDYVWIDTCCINQRDNNDVAKNIGSMFAFYQNAEKCYVYLFDVDKTSDIWFSRFLHSQWFRRGWTLQELLAPLEVIFFDCNWACLGSKSKLKDSISHATNVPEDVLSNPQTICAVDPLVRMSWIKGRKTTRPPDLAYCLFGLLGVSMPINYTETLGQAMKRLQDVYLDANPQYKDSKAFGPEIGPGSFLQIVDIVHEIQHDYIDAHHEGPSGELVFGQSTSIPLLDLKRQVFITGVLDHATDKLLVQYLEDFLTMSTYNDDKAQECRYFVLWYLQNVKEDSKFNYSDLELIGQCILEEMQDIQDNIERANMCLEVSLYLLNGSGRSGWHIQCDFYPIMFDLIQTLPLDGAFKQTEGYYFFKTFLDLAMCTRLVFLANSRHRFLSSEVIEQVQTGLAQDYILPHFLYLDSLASASFCNNLLIAIISHYIQLSCEFKIPPSCAGILKGLTDQPWALSYIHEKVQMAFAENMAMLLKAITTKQGLDSQSAKSTLSDVLVLLDKNSLAWNWMTSPQAARVLFNALSQYQPNPQGTAKMFRMLERGEIERIGLLKHCQQLLSAQASLKRKWTKWTQKLLKVNSV